MTSLDHAEPAVQVYRRLRAYPWLADAVLALLLLGSVGALAPVHGIFAAQEIKPQARTLPEDRGIRCVTLDYEAMRGVLPENTLFWP